MVSTSFPTVSGKTALGAHWACTLDGEYARRIEDECLVLWNSGITIWLDQYGNEQSEPMQARMDVWQVDASADAQDMKRELDRFSYVLEEEDGILTLNGFVFSEQGHLLVQMSMDDAAFLKPARAIFKSIKAV